MLKAKSILLLIIVCIMMLPRQLICTTHPFGHEHHEHDGPSPCELRRQYTGTYPAFWPPMDCDHIASQIEDFEETKTEKVISSLQSHIVATIHLDLHEYTGYEVDFIQLPEVRSNSDPPNGFKKDRTPPIPGLYKQNSKLAGM